MGSPFDVGAASGARVKKGWDLSGKLKCISTKPAASLGINPLLNSENKNVSITSQHNASKCISGS